MKLKISSKNWRIAVDEFGEPVIEFKGLHIDDFREIIKRINQQHYHHYTKRSVEI